MSGQEKNFEAQWASIFQFSVAPTKILLAQEVAQNVHVFRRHLESTTCFITIARLVLFTHHPIWRPVWRSEDKMQAKSAWILN